MVVVDTPAGQRLALVDLHQPGVIVDPTTWTSDAFRDAGIATVNFRNVHVATEALIAPPGWYGSRRGFWFGAVGVAATWAGIADSLVALLPRLVRRADEQSKVSMGEIEASLWANTALLDHAGRTIDGPANNGVEGAQSLALACRHGVRSAIERIVAFVDQEVGPAAFAFDPEFQRIRLELTMSLLQDHGARDLAAITRSLRDPSQSASKV
jgi:hypothetical protein